jgi:hypothetical protein
MAIATRTANGSSPACGTETLRVPRARVADETGKLTEGRSKVLPRDQRLTKQAEALIAAVYLAGANTLASSGRCSGCSRAPSAFAIVSRTNGATWRIVVSRARAAWGKADRDACCARSLAAEDIVRIILDGTVIETRLDKKATTITVLAAIGGRRPSGGIAKRRTAGQWTARRGCFPSEIWAESTAAWRQVLDDFDAPGLKRPACVIVDGAPGLEAAGVGVRGEALPLQGCTLHEHRTLLAHAPKHMHDALTGDCRDMIHADTAAELETRRRAFLRKWRLKCRAVADRLEAAGDRLFTFPRLDAAQWKSARTANAPFGRFALQIACRAKIERPNEAFRRRLKTQPVLPCAETVPMLPWAPRASGQIRMRRTDGWGNPRSAPQTDAPWACNLRRRPPACPDRAASEVPRRARHGPGYHCTSLTYMPHTAH